MTDSATPTVAVAFSGGHDSTALLHATCAAAKALGLQVAALHVHHGLLAEADGWLQQAQSLCTRWRRRGAPLHLLSTRLASRPASGDSVEAWARRERYAALAAMARQAGATLVLLAQHRRDQAETVLLQALRGAGPAGLAAMPIRFESNGLLWARPWLDQPRQAIDDYARRHRLRGADDPSNADSRYARSRLRVEVWPALNQAFDDADLALAAVARRAGEAKSALAELAELDLKTCAADAGLQVLPWSALSPARQSNALRHWCLATLGVGPPETLVTRLMSELPTSRAALWPAPGGELRLYRRTLAFVQLPLPTPDAPPTAMRLDLSHPGVVAVPAWRGSFEVSARTSGGVATSMLEAVCLRPRSGGEQFQLALKSQPRSLKKQFQARAVPEQHRTGPLVWSGDTLLFVPELGLDARALAAPGAAQHSLRWLPDAGT